MRPLARCAWIAVAALMIAATTSAAALDRAGTWSPSGILAPAGHATAPALISDGSFELGPPPASAWTEVAAPVCERIGDFSGEWYVSAYDGTYDFWAGGYCNDEQSGQLLPATASVTQTVTVPAGNSVLSFYYVAFRPDADDTPADGDRAYVAVNGEEKWALPLTRASNTYPSWTGPIHVDLIAYAGQDVALSIGGVSVGSVTGNARIDQIEFVADSVPTRPATWGSLKAIWR